MNKPKIEKITWEKNPCYHITFPNGKQTTVVTDFKFPSIQEEEKSIISYAEKKLKELGSTE